MNPRMRVVQPKDGEILDVIGEVVTVKEVNRDGGVEAYKFTFRNGAVMFVPVPSKLDMGMTTGSMRS